MSQRLRHVIASRDIIIREMDVINPVGAVNPCPSNLAWLMFRSEGRVQRLRVVFPGPERRASLQEGVRRVGGRWVGG
ncbi:hypothetical protein [Streptomyces sp. NBC_01361]|uniref:hypothetical protein n=1 Tax=Streptomyces sp. NBC_01361 TaxID=2903838 RepID=UPI002E3815EB|nr:hypothetical protein [Streptomyces sp. NBC_01361]